MTKKIYVPIAVGILSVLCFVFSEELYSQSKVQKPARLEYSFPAEGVKYLSSEKIIQTMDIMGQSMQANISSAMGCTIKPVGKTAGNLNLEVLIDTLGQQSDTPNGSSGGPIRDAIGKTFHMILSPSGKETDISDAKKITYNIEGSGAGDISQSFFDFFPDMPEKPVEPGYSWTATDTMNFKNESMSLIMVINAENKFDGFETYDGTECVKISTVLSGNREVKTNAQGMDVMMKGPFTGSGTLFFAPSRGYFLKQEVTTKMNGTMEITSPQAMTFPVVMDMTSVNQVVR